jgi:hypothetical protein
MLDNGRCRIYFASRDGENRSHVGWFEVMLDEPTRIVAISERPVLKPGPLGYFDDHGVYPSSIVRFNGRLYLYTIGWNPGVPSPLFYSSIGLALSEDGGNTFTKVGSAPILARSDHDPCLVTAPMVLFEAGRWRMWYVSGYRWEETTSGLSSRYHIKYAESTDGLCWHRDGRVCIAESSIGETNISRCCVRKRHDRYCAWYSYARGGPYRIGYAESIDGLSWARKDDQVDFRASGGEWDADAQAYPCVVEHRGQMYMFYNGNGYGREGIGLAIAEISEL